jgi:hypothetical protein
MGVAVAKQRDAGTGGGDAAAHVERMAAEPEFGDDQQAHACRRLPETATRAVWVGVALESWRLSRRLLGSPSAITERSTPEVLQARSGLSLLDRTSDRQSDHRGARESEIIRRVQRGWPRFVEHL